MGCAVAILLMIVMYAVSFGITAGIIKVLSMCFGFAFSWPLALGIWLIWCCLHSLISAGRS